MALWIRQETSPKGRLFYFILKVTLGAVDNSSDVTRVLCKVQLRMPSHAGGRWPTAGWGDLIIMRSNILKERSRSLRKKVNHGQ